MDYEPLKIDPEIAKKIRISVISQIDTQQALSQSRPELTRKVGDIITRVVLDMNLFLNEYERRQLTKETVDDMIGLGPVQPCIDDPTVSDVLINGANQVLVERYGKLELTTYKFRDEEHLFNLAQRIASMVGRRIDEASPMVDARLPDGSRVNVVIPPLALNGVCISIRKFSDSITSLEEYVKRDSLSQEMSEFLKLAARTRLNTIVSGGTGAGKTTLLNAMGQHVPSDQRIVTIEDAAELRLRQPFVVSLETRPPSLEGRGEVTSRDLLRNALRMRPDRIMLGEVRGHEAFDMLQAMNTGHDGSLSTVHANSPSDAMLRLENMLIVSGANMSSSLIRRQLASALDLLVQLERDVTGHRRVLDISEVLPDGDSDVKCEPIFRYVRERGGGGHFEKTGYIPTFTKKMLAAGTYEAFMKILSE
jgi:pilus assembly protein CpaF